MRDANAASVDAWLTNTRNFSPLEIVKGAANHLQ
jgi:hypothetical protein